jgi:hypothetical protein
MLLQQGADPNILNQGNRKPEFYCLNDRLQQLFYAQSRTQGRDQSSVGDEAEEFEYGTRSGNSVSRRVVTAADKPKAADSPSKASGWGSENVDYTDIDAANRNLRRRTAPIALKVASTKVYKEKTAKKEQRRNSFLGGYESSTTESSSDSEGDFDDFGHNQSNDHQGTGLDGQRATKEGGADVTSGGPEVDFIEQHRGPTFSVHSLSLTGPEVRIEGVYLSYYLHDSHSHSLSKVCSFFECGVSMSR